MHKLTTHYRLRPAARIVWTVITAGAIFFGGFAVLIAIMIAGPHA